MKVSVFIPVAGCRSCKVDRKKDFSVESINMRGIVGHENDLITLKRK